MIQNLKQNLKYANYKYQVFQAFRKQKEPTKFVIFSYPRSGSNLLCSMLNLHPHILCHHELFHPRKIWYSKDFHSIYSQNFSNPVCRQDLVNGKIGIDSIKQRDRNPENFIIKTWQHNYGCQAVGFKLFPNHIPNVAKLLLKDKDVKKILLLRQNKVKSYVSYLIAKKTKIWNESIKNQTQIIKGENNTVTVDVNSLLKWSNEQDRYFSQIRQYLTNSQQCFLEINYENLVDPFQKLVKSNVLEFLDVSAETSYYLQATLKKQNQKTIPDLVNNFAQLKQRLTGTKLESMLTD